MMQKIVIAEDFTEYPGGRYPQDGPGNGTDFRENFLVPVLESQGSAEIILDGAQGYPSSFLEEAFGGLIRKGYSKEKVQKTFKIVATAPGYARFLDAIARYIDLAKPTQKAS